MPYTKLASYQFERGKGFTEESVFAFHTLALEAIYELARNDRSSTATFPLSDDEVQLVLNHRAAAAEAAQPVISEPTPTYASHEVPATVTPDPSETAEVSDAATEAALGNPPDDDFAAAARWLALATRNETEPYQPSLVRQRG
jgi:uncharacterized membrane protein